MQYMGIQSPSIHKQTKNVFFPDYQKIFPSVRFHLYFNSIFFQGQPRVERNVTSYIMKRGFFECFFLLLLLPQMITQYYGFFRM